MFKTVINWFGSVILVSALVVFTSCGGSESGIAGEEEVIAVELTAHDGGDSASDPTFSIDVIRSACGTPDEEEVEAGDEPVSEEEPVAGEEANANIEALTAEEFYDTLGNATFHYVFYCPTCPAGAEETYIFESYTVEYIPLKSPSGSGGFFFPPKLVNLDKPILNTIILSKDFATAERAIILVTIQTKEEYVKKMLEEGGYDLYTSIPLFGLYSIRVTFHGRVRTGGPVTVTSTTEVSFGNYDNCTN